MTRKDPNSLSEKEEQENVMSWAEFHRLCKNYLFAIPNGGSRHIVEAVNLKKSGVKRGVSDLFLAVPTNEYHGLWLEMKRKNDGIISKYQKEFFNLMNKMKYCCAVAHGYDQAIDIIESYLCEKEKTMGGNVKLIKCGSWWEYK